MGNLPALAAAKVTEVSIVIFTSLEHIPIVSVVPTKPSLCSMCLHIGHDLSTGVYNGLGKNDNVAVLEEAGSVEQSVSSDNIKGCNCGRGAAKKDEARKFCKQIVGGVPSRCDCYKGMKGCHHRCHCVQCDNPYGTSQNTKAIYPLKRVRHPHKLIGKKSKRDANILLDKGVAPLLGWNGVQSMIFNCLVYYMISENIDINANACLSKYDELCQLAIEEGITCLVPKTLREIQGKLTHVRKCATIFEGLFKKQIELNWLQSMV